MKAFGKKVAGTGFVFEQLSAAKLPKDPAAVPQHAVGIIAKLRQKGIGAGERCIPLTDFVQKALDTLKDKRPAAAAAPGAETAT